MQRFFEDWTTDELRAARERLCHIVPILPLAAIESHGPHLPLGTDAILAKAMVDLVASRANADWPGLFLPVQSFGVSSEHTHFPGTIDLGWRTMGETVLAIGTSLRKAGFTKIALVNAHGGNSPTMAQVSVDLRARLGLLAATSAWLRFGYPAGLLPSDEILDGIHGGAVETSLMLHFRPDLVRGDKIADFPSRQTRMRGDNRYLTAHGRHGFGWMSDDLNPCGVVGDARLATREIGAAIAAHQADAFIGFIRDVAAFDLPPSDASAP
ncbi:creatininase family protein [Fulvimarina sp. 2208YS6-2-32]|uniref:Creatininase family protein n=1 Tax=Fulvimarina uroteuthidis TaxID=3098149 RepID=A0ABU5HYZ4_9HYPH|nr:creatininase family protein [Fulvimarina sp. 2208YS6-2-32]MDY8108347.1 creatininase family protein [Fulvimarina sp. 2208YS6-2-32]